MITCINIPSISSLTLISTNSLMISTSSTIISYKTQFPSSSNSFGNHERRRKLRSSCADRIIRLAGRSDSSGGGGGGDDDLERTSCLKLKDSWREIQGSNDWKGLLYPLDPLLRKELIRYGDFAQSCYDSFDFDVFSHHCGSCKYDREHFFDEVALPDFGYSVSRYLYATQCVNLPNFFKQSFRRKAWSPKANWIGYVAVSDDDEQLKFQRFGRKDITVAWRGTVTKLEWVADLMDILRPIKLPGFRESHVSSTLRSTVKVQSGFLDMYINKDSSCSYTRFSAREHLLSEIKRLVQEEAIKGNQEMSITITGHSLGAALAILSAYDIAETCLNVHPTTGNTIPITVFSFAGPRVGNRQFAQRMTELGIKVLRIINIHDTVPKVPGFILNEGYNIPHYLQPVVSNAFPWEYSHVGVKLPLDHTISPFLKEKANPSCIHNLEAHLHLLAGSRGAGKQFALSSSNLRDPALVNKDSDFLKSEYMVPPCWRQEANKGMVKDSQGKWVKNDPRSKGNGDNFPTFAETNHHLGEIFGRVP